MTWDGTYRPGQGIVCDLVSRAGQGDANDQIIAKLKQLEVAACDQCSLNAIVAKES